MLFFFKIFKNQLYFLFLLYFIIGTGLILFRPVFSDEGYYIWASQNVWNGELLYVDFVFHQLPLLPFIYAPFAGFGITSYYVLKLISMIFIFGLALVMYKHVLKITSDFNSANFAVLLLIFEGLFIDFNSLVKMFAMANFLCYLSFYLVSFIKFDSYFKDKMLIFFIGVVSGLASNLRLMLWGCTAVLFLYSFYSLYKNRKPVKEIFWFLSLFVLGVFITSLLTAYFLLYYKDYFIFGVFNHNFYSEQGKWADKPNTIKWLKFFLQPQHLILFILMGFSIWQRFKYKVLSLMFFIVLLAGHSAGYYIDEYLIVLFPYVIYIAAVNYRYLKRKLVIKGRPFFKYIVIAYVIGFFISVPYFRYMVDGRNIEPNLISINDMISYIDSLKGEKIYSSWYIYSLFSNKINDTLKNDYVYSTMINQIKPEEKEKYSLPDSAQISGLIKERYYDVIVLNDNTPGGLLQHKDMVKNFYKLERVYGNTKIYIK